MEREGERLLSRIQPGEFVVCLTIDGKRFSSEQFAKTLQDTFDRSVTCITFVIGGSLGLSPAVTQRADRNNFV